LYWKEIAKPSAREAVHEAGLHEAKLQTGQSIETLFNYISSPTPLQAHTDRIDVDSGPSLHIFEDLTGAGKTEASLNLAYRIMESGVEDGIYAGLPTMATANSMYDRLRSTYARFYQEDPVPSLVLAHGRADLTESFTETIAEPRDLSPEDSGDDGAALCSRWLADRRRASLVSHVGVGTIDQALLGALPVRYQSLRIAGLSRKVLIIDEVHSYDPYVLELLRSLIRFQLSNGASVILLSATLPQTVRRKLIDTAASVLDSPEAQPQTNKYPLATTLTSDGLVEQPIEPRNGSPRTYQLSFVEDEKEIVSYLTARSDCGEAACWIRNTVNDAIEAYRTLKSQLPEEKVHLFHGRFAFSDRSQIEREVLRRYGKTSGVSDRAGHVLVATQVVEQSLDVDFDAMVSDLAPIDLLLQRAGRLHRHDRDEEGATTHREDDRRGQPRLVVHGPHPTADPDRDWFEAFLPGAAQVYPDHARLWLTARLAKDSDAWSLPEDARDLIETVYGAEIEERMPSGLEERWLEATGQQKANASTGRFQALSVSEGYRPTAGAWTDQAEAQTRLAEHTKEIRLAKIRGDAIEPWVVDAEQAWSQSEVRVPSYTYHELLFPEGTQHLEESAREDMPDGGEWTDVLPLVEDDEGAWTGRVRTERGETKRVVYNPEIGLTDAQEDRG